MTASEIAAMCEKDAKHLLMLAAILRGNTPAQEAIVITDKLKSGKA